MLFRSKWVVLFAFWVHVGALQTIAMHYCDSPYKDVMWLYCGLKIVLVWWGCFAIACPLVVVRRCDSWSSSTVISICERWDLDCSYCRYLIVSAEFVQNTVCVEIVRICKKKCVQCLTPDLSCQHQDCVYWQYTHCTKPSLITLVITNWTVEKIRQQGKLSVAHVFI